MSQVGWGSLLATLEERGAGPEELQRTRDLASRQSSEGVNAADALASLGAGATAALEGLIGRGLTPLAWAETAAVGEPKAAVAGKEDMTVLGSTCLNGDFLPHFLTDSVTPIQHHFVRNNGTVPQRAQDLDAQGWTLTIDGEVRHILTLTLDELRQRPAVTVPIVLECAGNGRRLFDPKVGGSQWSWGAVACSEWTGVRLQDLLEEAGLLESAVYTAHYGEDLAGGRNHEPFSRGIPIAKALDPGTLVVYAMNGEPLSTLHGFPARLIVPGWIGSCSQKWLTRIRIIDRVHESEKMSGYSYRMPRTPAALGIRPPEDEMEVATHCLVKSMITAPAAATSLTAGKSIPVSGHAWAGERRVERVAVSSDYGLHWHEAAITRSSHPHAWVDWKLDLTLEKPGDYEIWSRAFDDQGDAQPFRQPWNPEGYLGNMIHRLPVTVEAGE